ncbi:hypothetical protein LCGC14_1573690 [marine sediment metagenome]|uniref:Portal protein n=1 Tax=marine sediment metagenome TaxID=412755 RepID=A0A0F9IJ17_9ZZZZ
MIKDLGEAFGFKNIPHDLVLNPPLRGSYKEGGIIRSIKVSKKNLNRIPKEDLENIYFKDPLLFNSINKSVQMVTAAGHRIAYSNPKEEKKFKELFNNLGRVGEDYTWEELYYYFYWAQDVFGAAWTELIYDKESDSEIIDLSRLDPKVMDYARNSDGNVLLDEDQKPIGYTQKLPYGIRSEGKGDEIPQKYKKIVDYGANTIFLLPKRISLIKMHIAGDGLSFYGSIEPTYSSSVRKLLLEEAGTNSAYQRWMSPLIAYIGDDKHPPNAQLSKETLKTMQNMKYDVYSTYPYYVKHDVLSFNTTEALNDILKYLRENQAAGVGMPMPFATGAGEATNRATLNNQQSLLQFTLNDMAKKTAISITRNIFKPIAESMGLKTYPVLLPNKISVDEIEDKAERFVKYVQSGILSPKEAKPIIMQMEGIVSEELPKEKEPKEKPVGKEKLEKPEEKKESEND